MRWLEEGKTPELSDLGKRIAACIRKHGFNDERSWLIESMRIQFKQSRAARLALSLEKKNGAWRVSEWRPA
jgi:hypothetical protein